MKTGCPIHDEIEDQIIDLKEQISRLREKQKEVKRSNSPSAGMMEVFKNRRETAFRAYIKGATIAKAALIAGTSEYNTRGHILRTWRELFPHHYREITARHGRGLLGLRNHPPLTD